MSPLPEETGGAVVEEPAVEAFTTEPEAGYSHEDVVESAASVDRYETTIRSSQRHCRIFFPSGLFVDDTTYLDKLILERW